MLFHYSYPHLTWNNRYHHHPIFFQTARATFYAISYFLFYQVSLGIVQLRIPQETITLSQAVDNGDEHEDVLSDDNDDVNAPSRIDDYDGDFDGYDNSMTRMAIVTTTMMVRMMVRMMTTTITMALSTTVGTTTIRNQKGDNDADDDALNNYDDDNDNLNNKQGR